MRRLYLDLVGGAAGDMLMAALVDAGASQEAIQRTVARLGLEQVELRFEGTRSAGLRALHAHVFVDGTLADTPQEGGSLPSLTHVHGHAPHGHHRSYPSVRQLLQDAGLAAEVERCAQAAFRHLAEAEAHSHGVDVEAVEFHEVGADDALVDVVGVGQALASLGVVPEGLVSVSPVPLGRGLIQGAHGPIPLPGPAALRLLEGAPVVPGPDGETVTPTGAALLRAMNPRFGPMPAMTLERVGVGAGHRAWPDRPNVVRALVGTASESSGWGPPQRVVEANVDDLLPVHVPGLLSALLEAGAWDAWSAPVVMKKGRPGLTISALCGPNGVEAVVAAFFRHSSTAGVRVHSVERKLLPRSMKQVQTEFGPVAVKVLHRPGGPEVVPEPDDVARRAREQGASEREVHRAALRAGAPEDPENP